MKNKLSSLIPAAACLALLIASPVSLPAAILTVTSTADSGVGTLRVALAGAGNSDTIDATGVSGTITLTSGQLNVPNSVTILGPGPGVLTVSGNNASGVFNVTGTNVTISGLTIANGYSTTNGAGINAAGGPGSVLTVSGCVITNNNTTQNGGGIYNNNGTLMVIASTIRGNLADFGAGIVNWGQPNGATLTVNASTLSGNSASSGGGILNWGQSGNATLIINASTLSGNSASYGGGGIDNNGWYGNGTVKINASTFSGNSAPNGGGIYSDVFSGIAEVEIGDTIFKAGATGANILNNYVTGIVTSDGDNLSSDNGGGFLTATGDQNNTDPKLGPLQDNGGPTWTCALLPGSPAIDQGKTNAVPGLGLATDQRGFTRPVILPGYTNAPGGDGSDIGAFEVQSITVTNTADSGPGTLRAELASAVDGEFIDATGASGTITLATGQLNVSNSVTILGPGPGALTVSGNGTSPVFNITGANVAISGLTIANGQSAENGAGINAAGSPGSSLTVNNCVITNNSTTLDGGGIYSSLGVILTVTNCTISGNSAPNSSGGGIFDDQGGTLTVVDSTLANNSAAYGGAIYNHLSKLTINTSTVSSNSAAECIANDGAWTDVGTSLTINASTFNHNSTTAADIFNDAYAGGGATLVIGDTILNANPSATTIYNREGTVTSAGYNLSSDNGGGFLTATGDQTNTDPLLGPLQDNGGPAWTQALLPGSPAIDAGKCNAITNLVCATDQRGLLRVVDLPDYPNVPGGDGSDIGAYEVQVDAAMVTRPSFNTNGAGWYLNGDTVNGGPKITNNVFTLTDGAGGENRSAWFSEPLYVGGFQASFTYQDIGGGGADGTAFVIQNDPNGTAALGLNGGGLGYVGITPSVAVLLNIFWDSPGGAGLMLGTNGVGAYYASGTSSGRSYQSTAPVNLAGGNPIAVGLRYTGGMLYASFTDTATSNQFQTIIPVDIPAFVGTNAAWVGFTGSEGGTTSHQIVSNFSYRPLPTLTIRQSQPPSLVFTWPAAVYGFTLQSNSSLNNPAGWTSVAGTSTQTNGLNQVTTPSPTSAHFYRLVLPGGP